MSFSKLIYTFLILVIMGTGYYLYDKSADENQQVEPSEQAPMFTGQNVYNISYDETGLRKYKLYSVHIEYYSQDGRTEFNKPKLIVYQEGNPKVEEWHVISDDAVLNDEHELTLIGNVVAKNQIPGSTFDTLKTERMLINLDTKDFSTNTKVTMVGPQFTNTGNAMKGNFGTNVATLFNKAKGIYETNTP